MSKKKAPLCKILIPAPWQRRETLEKGIEESSGWERDDHITEELSTAELTALVWSAEESLTPLSETSENIAAQEREDTRLPAPDIDEDF